MLTPLLSAYGLDEKDSVCVPFGSGLINSTWKVTSKKGEFILQELNTDIFKHPEHIAFNLHSIKSFLTKHYPYYIFPAPLNTLDGRLMVTENDKVYRLLPFVQGSHTVNFLTEPQQAFEGAKQFGMFTRVLQNFASDNLYYTLPDFHNLELRITGFEEALRNASEERKEEAKEEIAKAIALRNIARTFQEIKTKNLLPLRVIHHDTKINNVLLDQQDRGMAVIDLDTVMPGFYISDVGDMMRTYLAEANEEEKDPDKITIRPEFFEAIYRGYMSEMGNCLNETEKEYFIYSGRFMIYMQAIRFLTDYLNKDIYYHISYSGQNLVRAKNQFRLLDLYIQMNSQFETIIKQCNNGKD